jgi:hypothetical protein
MTTCRSHHIAGVRMHTKTPVLRTVMAPQAHPCTSHETATARESPSVHPLQVLHELDQLRRGDALLRRNLLEHALHLRGRQVEQQLDEVTVDGAARGRGGVLRAVRTEVLVPQAADALHGGEAMWCLSDIEGAAPQRVHVAGVITRQGSAHTHARCSHRTTGLHRWTLCLQAGAP